MHRNFITATKRLMGRAFVLISADAAEYVRRSDRAELQSGFRYAVMKNKNKQELHFGFYRLRTENFVDSSGLFRIYLPLDAIWCEVGI